MNKLLRIKTLLIVIILYSFFGFGKEVDAAVISSPSCQLIDIQSAIESASNGDVIEVPPGECIWNSGITFTKNLTLKGAGIDTTTITAETTLGLALKAKAVRITGFTFNNFNVSFEGVGFRIDNNKFNGIGNTCSVNISNDVPYEHPTGVIDSNQFINTKIQVFGGAVAKSNTEWTLNTGLGGSGNVVYIEDNTFYRDDALLNVLDGNYAGMYVFRYNTVYGGYLMSHSIQGTHRGFKKFEIYGNVIERNPSLKAFYAMFMRGGTGVIFNNSVKGEWANHYILFDNKRDFDPDGEGGLCDGSSPWDGNEDVEGDGITGYPCRDQIGRGRDIELWQWTPTVGAYTQEHEPAYLWMNIHDIGLVSADVVGASKLHIKQNRDYFEYNPVYNGSMEKGVYCGNSLPANCTINDGAWITSQSCSDSTGMVGVNPANPFVGTLYKCTATNTWTEYYTPYTYPHPLRNESSDSVAPSAPTGLSIW